MAIEAALNLIEKCREFFTVQDLLAKDSSKMDFMAASHKPPKCQAPQLVEDFIIFFMYKLQNINLI